MFNKFFYSFIFLLLLFFNSCYKTETGESDKDFLPSSFGYDRNETWSLFNIDNKKIDIDETNLFKNHEPKIIRVQIRVKNSSSSDFPPEFYFWLGGFDQDNSTTLPFIFPPRNLIYIINYLEKDKEYLIYPPKNDLNKYRSWTLTDNPFSDKFFTVKTSDILSVIKKETYLINRNSFIENKEKYDFNWDVLFQTPAKFYAKGEYVRLYIEADSEGNSPSKITFDSGLKKIRR